MRKWITSIQNAHVLTIEWAERNGWDLEGRARTRLFDHRDCETLLQPSELCVRGEWWRHVSKGLFSFANQYFFLNYPLLCPWMSYDNFRISLVGTVCERMAWSVLSSTKTDQYEYESVVWGNGKNPRPIFSRGVVDMTTWAQCISYDRVIGSYWPLFLISLQSEMFGTG